MNFTKTTLKTSLLIVTGMTTMVHPSRAANIRVPQDYPTIQSAVNSANAADTIFVSAGTYNEFNIQITNNVSISSLNGPTNTIIDMQHNGRGFIVTGATLTNVSIIGFAIQNAQIPYRDGVGAINVVSGKCRISRCIIQGTSGAADYSGVTIGNQNTNVDDVLVENCIIHKNFAANNVGIAAPAVFNCWVYGNTGGNNCSALSGCNATNCTVYGNGGVFLPNPWTVGGGSQGYWKNCIVWNNLPSYNNQQIYQPVSVSYCIVMGGFPGTGNLSSDPLFVNPASGDFRLQANSPAKGSGDPSIVKADGSRSDIGASGDINDGFPITTPGSLEFNGTNTYVSVDGSFLGGITTNQFTLDGWFRTPEPNRPQYLIQKTENWKEWAFSITQDGGLSFFNAWPFSYYTLDTPLNLVHTNTWHHFALVVSGLDQRIYSNGQLATNAMLNSQVSFHAEIAGTTLAPMVFGLLDSATTPDSAFFRGEMADFAVFDRALAADEVTSRYTGRSASTIPGIRHWFPFNEGTGNTVSDVIGGLVGVVHNGSWSPLAPPETCSPHKATATLQLVNGFVVGATITDPGCGYTNAPAVLIQGGGGNGATATAVVSGGQVTAINITVAGCCYTNAPTVVIASPPFVPTVSIAVSKVKVTQNVVLGRNYVLEQRMIDVCLARARTGARARHWQIFEANALLGMDGRTVARRYRTTTANVWVVRHRMVQRLRSEWRALLNEPFNG